MKVLTFQYNSVYQHGGAGRVLRRLFEGHEDQVTSMFLKTHPGNARTGLIKEIPVQVVPLQLSWMRWRLRNLAIWLREVFFLETTARKVRKVAATLEFDVIHTVNHGPFSTIFCNDEFSSTPLWVSFHDHFSTCSTFEDAQKLWNCSERRLMISREMGIEYQRLFGDKTFDLITDGVATDEISLPKSALGSPLTVYFAGLLHLDYIPLFAVLADALEAIHKEGRPLKLVLRGTQKLDFLEGRPFEVDYRQDFVTDAQVKAELDAADILYLPIKFNLPDFYLYSLSTKLISYLGGAGTILYHGPADSAACNLISEYQAGACATSLEVTELKEKLTEVIQGGHSFSANAKKLAAKQFDLKKIQDRFWSQETV